MLTWDSLFSTRGLPAPVSLLGLFPAEHVVGEELDGPLAFPECDADSDDKYQDDESDDDVCGHGHVASRCGCCGVIGSDAYSIVAPVSKLRWSGCARCRRCLVSIRRGVRACVRAGCLLL
ncbi:hypothetical protein F5X97DRAFT_305363 [Nemania serpens]|nr:hypothetical protein F5X97DRAFT_305363 [Nemania serpens]